MRLRLLAISMLLAAPPQGSLSQPPAAYEHATVPYQFQPRSGEQVAAELGSFSVPENRRKQDSRRITLKYIRFPATGDTSGAPIVYLAGGPGGSGSGTAEGTRFGMFMKLRALGDVIMFDQRGTGMSDALPDVVAKWDLSLDKRATRAAAAETVRKAMRESLAAWTQEGVDLDAYNTEESADDIAALAEILQTEQLRIVGISYGTHLGLSVMRRHPQVVERAVLAGLEGPDHTLKLPNDQQRLLEQIDGWVKQDEQARQAYPDFLGAVQRVIERLEDEPATVKLLQTEVVITAFDVRKFAASSLRGPESFRRLPKLFADMDQGNFSSVTYFIRLMRRGQTGPMSIAMDAASWASDSRLAEIERQAEQTLLGDVINFPLPIVHAELAVRDLGAAFRADIVSATPVLAISGTADGRTPPSNATEVLRNLPNGRHLLIEGAGHSDPLFLSSPRILEVMLQFLSGQAVENETITLPPMKFD